MLGRLLVLLVPLVAPAAAVEASPAPCVAAPVAAPVIDPFRPPACRWCAGNRGLEYGTAPGITVRAGAAGTVSFAGPVAGVRYVVVAHPGGLRTTYGRLGTVAVRAGDPVVRGSVVGTTSGPLYFGVRVGSRYVDPGDHLLRTLRRARLIPIRGRPRPPTRTGLTCTAGTGRR